MSVRPSIFLYAKNLGETGPPVPVFISMDSDQLLSLAERAVTDPSNSDTAMAVRQWTLYIVTPFTANRLFYSHCIDVP